MVRKEAIKEIMYVEDIHGFSDQHCISRNHFSSELVFAVAAAMFSFFLSIGHYYLTQGREPDPKNFSRTLGLGV